MKATTTALTCSSSSPSKLHSPFSISTLRSHLYSQNVTTIISKSEKRVLKIPLKFSPPLNLTSVPPLHAVAETLDEVKISSFPSTKLDKTGRFCSPRSARELSLLIVYASCLEGSDPVRLFEKRVNAKRYPGFVFDRTSLLEYNHMSFSGAPIYTETEEEAQKLLLKNDKETANEVDVLSAPLKLVYNKFVLQFTKKILEAVVDRWDQHILIMDKITPPSWKNEPGGRILELCILHLAMAEITVIGTRHQIVINEAVDLAKRFCDGSAPRIINGCLRTFVRDHLGTEGTAQKT